MRKIIPFLLLPINFLLAQNSLDTIIQINVKRKHTREHKTTIVKYVGNV